MALPSSFGARGLIHMHSAASIGVSLIPNLNYLIFKNYFWSNKRYCLPLFHSFFLFFCTFCCVVLLFASTASAQHLDSSYTCSVEKSCPFYLCSATKFVLLLPFSRLELPVFLLLEESLKRTPSQSWTVLASYTGFVLQWIWKHLLTWSFCLHYQITLFFFFLILWSFPRKLRTAYKAIAIKDHKILPQHL